MKIENCNNNIISTPIVHIMFNEKFNKPFVDFLNKNFNNDEHLILCKRAYNELLKPFPEGENVIEINSLEQLDFKSDKIEKIICHSLFDPELVDLLYKKPELLEKAYWVIWGGDLYGSIDDEKTNFVKSRFKGYLTVSTGDKDIVIERYNDVKGAFIDIQYIIPTTLIQLNKAKENKEKNKHLKIQINNSICDSTLEALDILSKFKDEKIKITTILSCGKMEFKDEIIKKGKETFGNKFEYLDKMVSTDEYAKHLSTIDILVLSQNRQQALGNIVAGLHLGTKIFIKSNISTYKMLKNDMGFDIFDTFSINKLSFDDFTKNLSIEKNHKKASLFFDEKHIKSLWEKAFKHEN